MLPHPARRYRERLSFAKIISAGRDGVLKRTLLTLQLLDGL
jgi:hypothetical protein